TGHTALRDRALLLFLYNTGARVQEAADLMIGPQPRVNLHGKGDKWRTCPLWPETARLLRELLAVRAGNVPRSSGPVFTSKQGGPSPGSASTSSFVDTRLDGDFGVDLCRRSGTVTDIVADGLQREASVDKPLHAGVPQRMR